jgi:DNA-binding FadR family transcriptional regulator
LSNWSATWPTQPALPLQAIEPRRLYRQIADQLRALIAAGEFGLGSRLPPERDLAVQLGVSRPSVREALIALEVEGLVEVRMGSGIYVRAGAAARRAASSRRMGPSTSCARQLIAEVSVRWRPRSRRDSKRLRAAIGRWRMTSRAA